MIPRLICLLLCWDFAAHHLGRAQKLPGVKKASLKVQINATSDTVVLKFLRPTPNINLEGFILGYGSSFFSTQYIPLPENGNSYDTELDAEPRYLVAVRPSPIVNGKKPCSAQNKVQKPLQVVVGTLTPTSVYLAWGVLVNPQNDWTVLNKCPTDRFYTVRYREKENSKKWNFQLCPSTEAVVDNLKPNIIYEFGVKDNSEDGTWNKGVTHQTTVPPKHKNGGNGHIQNTYPKGHIQVASEDTKMLVPVTVIKHVVQNISNGKKPKSTVSSALPTSTTTSERQPGSKNPPEHKNIKKPREPLAQTESEVEPSEFHVSATPGLPLTTLAVNNAHPLPVILATSEAPETAKATAVNQMTQVPQVPPITKRYISTEHPESTLVSNELPLFIPTVGTTQRTGKQFTDPAEVRQMTQGPPTDIVDISPAQPDSTPVSNEPNVLASREDTAAVSDIHQSKPATTKPNTPEPFIPKSQPEEQPKTTLDFNETPSSSSESKIYEKPETLQTDPVRWTSQKPLTPKPSRRPKRPKTTLGPKDSFFIPSKLSTSVKPGVLQSEPGPKPTQRVPINLIRLHFTEEDPGEPLVPNEIHELPSAKPKADQTTQKALPTPVPKKTQHVPISLIHLHIFGDPDTTLVPNETSKAKTVHPTERPQTKNVPKSTHRVPINLIRLQIFEDPSVTLAPSETQKTSSKPISQTTELPHVKADFEEVHTEPTKPKIFTPRPRPQTTQAPRKFNPSSSRPKTSARPRTRPVPNRKTQATALPNSSNDLNWISETAVGAKLTGQDVTKLLGVSRNTSTELNGTVKRPISGSSLPPPRPTHMRRRPFPPNNVTGRPGIAGNGLMPRSRTSSSRHVIRPTQVAEIERTPSPKLRTTSAPEKETVTEPVFNASPLEDFDPLGKQRFTAPHVKYMRKEDLVPCSITETMRHFPTEMATNEEEATIAPQNPPSNLTVVAVEGCPSFVILDWKPPENDTVKEYTVISTENGEPTGKNKSILTTNQTHSTVENLKPDTSYEFKVIATNIIGEGPPSTTVTHNTESADPRVSEPITGGKDAIWTEIKFKSDSYSECKGKQYVKRTWYKKFVGIQLCNSLRYKIYLSDSLSGKFYNIGDESGYGEDHCQFVDSFLDGRTGQQLYPDQLPNREGFYRSVRQQPVEFGKIGSQTHIRYVHWYECGTTIPGKW